MLIKNILLFLSFSIYLSSKFTSKNAFDVSKLKIASTTDQIMIVTPFRYTSSIASFHYYIKKGEEWEEILSSQAYIGRDGLGLHSEDDLKSPIGVFNFTNLFGIGDNPGTNLPYTKVNDSIYWVSDPKSPKYNKMVNIETFKDFDPAISEHLIEYPVAYKYAININYNPTGIPGIGSAIFLHCTTNNLYTGGCVSLPEKNLVKVFKLINENAVIIIDEAENIYNY